MKWPEVEIRQIAQVVSGFGFPRKFQGNPNEEFPFFKVGDMNSPGNERCMNLVVNTISAFTLKKLKAKTFPPGTIIFPKIGAAIATNKKRMLTQPSVVDNNVMGLIPSDLIDEWYLYYWMQQFDLRSVTNIGPVPSMRKTEVERVRIPLPTPSEQRRIVEILDQADALRKKRAEADAKAARILPALFYRMFGDPATNPKGWPTDKLGNLFDVVGGGTPSKSVPEYWEGDIPWVSPKDMKFDVILDTEDHITPEAIRNSATRLISQGAVLVVYRSGILAHSFPVAIAGRDVTINQDLKALTSKSEIRNEYLFGLLSALPSIGLSCVKKGATVHNIDGSRFLGLKIPKPSKTLQDAFAVHLETLLTHKEKRQAVGEEIEKLFSVLLHRAFTGDLTAQWREAHIKELLAEMEQQAKALEASVVEKRVPEVKSKRHAGHDMYNKAALAAYITNRCHADDRPLGRVKVAKLFYLAQRKAELELTEQFALRAAGPVDDDIHKFLSLARKQKWVVLGRAQGDLKPVRPGKDITKGVEQAAKVLGAAKNKVDELLDLMKDWGWRTLERWATVLHAAEAIVASGGEVSVATIKKSIDEHPEWKAKLNRAEFSDENLASTLKGLREFGFIGTD